MGHCGIAQAGHLKARAQSVHPLPFRLGHLLSGKLPIDLGIDLRGRPSPVEIGEGVANGGLVDRRHGFPIQVAPGGFHKFHPEQKQPIEGKDGGNKLRIKRQVDLLPGPPLGFVDPLPIVIGARFGGAAAHQIQGRVARSTDHQAIGLAQTHRKYLTTAGHNAPEGAVAENFNLIGECHSSIFKFS